MIITKDEENRTLVANKNFDKLLKNNKRYITKLLNKYGPKNHDDLRQEAALGLLEAMNRFNPIEDIAFITYAAIWMRKYCNHYLNNNARTVRLPKNKIQEEYLHIEQSLDNTHHQIKNDEEDDDSDDDHLITLKAVVMKHFNSLKESYQIIIKGIVIDKKTFNELSNELGISKQGLNQRYNLAIKKLKQLMEV